MTLHKRGKTAYGRRWFRLGLMHFTALSSAAVAGLGHHNITILFESIAHSVAGDSKETSL